MENINQVLANPGLKTSAGDSFNLDLIRKVVEEANQTGDLTSMKIMNRAMSEFLKNVKPKVALADSIASWEAGLKKRNTRLSNDAIEDARRCLFTPAV